MYKQDLALNNPQGLICYKTQPTSTNVQYHHKCEEEDNQLNPHLPVFASTVHITDILDVIQRNTVNITQF